MTILIVHEESAGKVLAGVPLLDLVIQGESIDDVYEKAQAAITAKLEEDTSVKQEVAEINRQIAELEKRRADLSALVGDYEALKPIVDESESKIYRSVLSVLENDTRIEEALKRQVRCVEFVPDEDGNIYGTALTWRWYFGKYFKSDAGEK